MCEHINIAPGEPTRFEAGNQRAEGKSRMHTSEENEYAAE